MGKHEVGYARVERDLYPTPSWVTEALLRHVDVAGMVIWEPAAGRGDMAQVLRGRARRVHCTDIETRGYPLACPIDFTERSRRYAPLFDAIVTNPPFGPRGTLATAFIQMGLWHLERRGEFLALLLPADFDSAGGRRELFGDCPRFAAKLVLTKRIVWFSRSDGVTEAPKENHAWFIWRAEARGRPVLLYADGE
jgi:hypothetical protein